MSEAIRAAVKAPEIKKENQVSHVQKGNFNKTVSSPVEQILFLQRTIGNQAVQRLMKSGLIQTKLRIGAPGDVYEQEADRVAEQVMRMSEPQPVASGSPYIQRACPKCENDELNRQPIKEEDEELHRKVKSTETVKPLYAALHIQTMAKSLEGENCSSALGTNKEDEDQLEEKEETSVMGKLGQGMLDQTVGSESIEKCISNTRGGGSSLPGATRRFMESRFGHDFSGVRLHTDSNAAWMAEKLNAEAFTSRNDIYFRQGSFSPHTLAGNRLLAHELTHVVQQRSAATSAKGSTISGKARAGSLDGIIQCYSLKGFPAAEAAAMNSAIPAAISTVKSCSKLSWLGKLNISTALNNRRYDYVEDLGHCGWTFPTSWYIEVGKKAFDRDRCCDLPSTLAHEAAHTEYYTEGMARKMECNCFGCSC